MSNEIALTVVGNLTADPELRYTQNGLAVANFTIAQTPRTFDRAANEWKDGEAVFLRGSIWRDYAEHVAASLHKGQPVIATGHLKQRTYLDEKTNTNRTSYEFEIDEVGPSLRYGTAVYSKSASSAQNAQAAGLVAPAAQVAAPVVPQAAAPVAVVPVAVVVAPVAAPVAQAVPPAVADIQF